MDPYKVHSRMGRVDAWTPQMRDYAELMYGKGAWPDIMQQIAGVRAGQPGAVAPRAVDIPGYKEKTPEDQLFSTWVLEQLLTGAPGKDLGTSRVSGWGYDPQIEEAERLSGR